jgi:hypothetical protein
MTRVSGVLLVAILLAVAGCPRMTFEPEDRGDGWTLDDDGPADGFPLGDLVADAKFVGEHWGDQAGFSVASAGDVDGDGRDDVVIGSPYQTAGGGSYGEDDAAGAAYLMTGPVEGMVHLADATAKWVGTDTWDKSGWDVASLESAAGNPRIAIGSASAWGGTSTPQIPGTAHVVVADEPGEHSLAEAQATLQGVSDYDCAGFALAGIGDVDGDGAGELAVGARGDDTAAHEAGAVYIWDGTVAGAVAIDGARATWLGEFEYAAAGWAVAGAGDADDDGTPDVLVGAPFLSYDVDAPGRAYLIDGGATGVHSLGEATAILEGELPDDGAGRAVAGGGDVDGDGIADLLVGAPMESAAGEDTPGVVYLVLGPVTGERSLADADARLSGREAEDGAGSAVAMVGDVDGDGYGDLLVVSARADTEAGSGASAAYLLFGPLSGSMTLGDQGAVIASEWDVGGYWSDVAGAGDVDGDGLDDFLLGARPDDSGGTWAGAAYLVYGRPSLR